MLGSFNLKKLIMQAIKKNMRMMLPLRRVCVGFRAVWMIW